MMLSINCLRMVRATDTRMTGIANDEERRKAGMRKNCGASLTPWVEEEISMAINRNRNVEQNIGRPL